MEIQALPYIDIQHDALSVFDDVEQGIVQKENIWISGYCEGSSSVHGKVTVSQSEGGSQLVARDGVQVERTSRANFTISIPSLDISSASVRFPRQVIHPPFKKATAVSAPLHINAIAHSPTANKMVVCGPDGYCVVVPCGPDARIDEKVELKGHVGDVIDAKWFPSGEVILTASSDLSLRVFRASDGLNPRVLKGHTRALTSISILGIGKQVVSSSKDGSVRVWEVGSAKEVRKWETSGQKAILKTILVEDAAGLSALGAQNQERCVLAMTATGLEVFDWEADAGVAGGTRKTGEWGVGSNLVSAAYDPSTGTLATGHANGIIALRTLDDLEAVTIVRRNEASVYSLLWDEGDLLVGTASGLPCRLAVETQAQRRDVGGEGNEELPGGEGRKGGYRVSTKEEYAGWEAVGVETWTWGLDGSVWCAGGEGGIRRY